MVSNPMMISKLPLFQLFLLVLVTSIQANAAVLRPILFEARRGNQTVTLLASMHFGGGSFSDYPETVKKRLKNSGVFLAELAEINAFPKDECPIDRRQLDLKHTVSERFYSQLQSLLRRKVDWKKIERLCRGLFKNDEVASIEKLRERFIYEFLWQQYLANAVEASMDVQAFKMAKQAGVPTFALEGDRFLNRIFDRSIEESFVFATTWVSNREKRFRRFQREMAPLQKGFREGRLEIFDFWLNQPSFAKVPFRNRLWVENIERALKNARTAFVIGGVGHFVGPESMQQLMKNAGFSVKRIH